MKPKKPLFSHLGGANNCYLAYNCFSIPLFGKKKLPSSWNYKILHVILSLTVWISRTCTLISDVRWVICLSFDSGAGICNCFFIFLKFLFCNHLQYSDFLFRTVLQPQPKPRLFFLLEIYGDEGGSKVSLQLDDLFLCFTLNPPYPPVPLCTVIKTTPFCSHRGIHPLIIQWKMQEIAFCS